MSFRLDFDPIADNGAFGDDDLLSRITIRVGGEVATRLEDDQAKLVRPYARLSALRLAEWFVTHWWRLRWESASTDREQGDATWRLSHQMTAVGDGYIWPDITFLSTLDDIRIVARAFRPAGSLRYLTSAQDAVPPELFESTLDRFIAGVLDRASALSTLRRGVRSDWAQVNCERADPEWRAFRRLEAILGFDCDGADPDLIENLRRERDRLGTAAIDEVASASKAQVQSALKKAEAYIEGAGVEARFSDGWAGHRRTERSIGALELAGQLRSDLGLDPTSAVSDNVIGDLCGLKVSAIARTVRQPIGGGLRRDDGQTKVGLRFGHPTSHRFELMRLLADHLHADDHADDRFLPITDAKTSRQRYQRAFSQQFLCPLDGLLEHLRGGALEEEDFTQAAQHFAVSEFVVRNVLVNNEIIGRRHLP